MLSSNAGKRLITALTSKSAGNEVATILNNSAWAIPLAVVATSVSATVNFAALLPGDLLIHIPAAAGNSVFESVVTAGTKPSAAIVGDLYVAVRLASSNATTFFL